MWRAVSRVTKLPTPATRASSSSAIRPAALASNQPPAASSPPPPPPRPSPKQPQAQPQKAQPFILRPLAKRYQLQSVEAAPAVDPASASTTLSFVSPSDPNAPKTVTVPNLWLRDASVHPDHVHPSSNQRLFKTTDIPLTGKLIGYGVHDLPNHGECLVTEWSKPLQTPGTNPTTAKLSVVPTKYLVALLENPQHPLQGELPAPRTWDRAAALEKTLVKIPYDRFRSDDKALFETLDALVQDGIVFLTGVPTAEREGHHTELRKAVERIGSLRRTWYGDLWDVKAVEGSLNIAYTNLDLGLHMDLTCVVSSYRLLLQRRGIWLTPHRGANRHFDNPPRYQFLHSLQNARVKGGLSYFVDTYAVAAHLHATAPSVFSILAHENVHFEYRNGGQHTRFVRPTLELAPGSNSRLHAVNYSPPFQGPLPLERLSTSTSSQGVVSDDAQRLADLHDALSQFSQLCDDPASQFRFEHQLEPGQCVIFDNRRVLHARTAFEFLEPPTTAHGEEDVEVGRWLKGAYMDGDELWSKWRVLSQKLREQDEERLRTKGRTLFV
ncbi:hypothetical protein C6P46_003504 [Rhodotorula mucilaginosa]|jgi:gamma-butyrobetaine dioxygenase|uniref:TauD/TfdA-like domain-containing protein n=1 Tax=Rhodotorula mucilaginosa TaxID=5537 RepID=A0A9P7B6A6_RHOMI|nr:hypothetical protein C6P46_003504 [Rhodotorula mucilaginosa]